jgi:hypothetical protein
VAKVITGTHCNGYHFFRNTLNNRKENGMNHSSKKAAATLPLVRCAIYTRKSTEEGPEQEFNSLDAQRDSAEAFIRSQTNEGWTCLPERYDDGGFTGGNGSPHGCRCPRHERWSSAAARGKGVDGDSSAGVES